LYKRLYVYAIMVATKPKEILEEVRDAIMV